MTEGLLSCLLKLFAFHRCTRCDFLFEIVFPCRYVEWSCYLLRIKPERSEENIFGGMRCGYGHIGNVNIGTSVKQTIWNQVQPREHQLTVKYEPLVGSLDLYSLMPDPKFQVLTLKFRVFTMWYGSAHAPAINHWSTVCLSCSRCCCWWRVLRYFWMHG